MKIGQFLINLIFPQNCLVCGQPGEVICFECLQKQPRAKLRCLTCGSPTLLGRYCPPCRTKFKPDRVIARFEYSGPIREVVHQFKYNRLTSVVSHLSAQLVSLVKNIPDLDNYHLVPIPLSKNRVRERGYNQAFLLARGVSQRLNLKLSDIMRRTTTELTQVESGSRLARQKNIRGTFSVKPRTKIPPAIILVDDVITTGATIEEAAKILKRNGAQKVIVVAVAMG